MVDKFMFQFQATIIEMWKLCFFALVLFVSCSDAQFAATVTELISKVLGAEKEDPYCMIDKWSYAPLKCESEKAAFCLGGVKDGDCPSCLFLCARNVEACERNIRDIEKVEEEICRYSGTKCEFKQWSGENGAVHCNDPYIEVAINNYGQIMVPDKTTAYHTCMIDGCNGCPSNQVFYEEEIPCQNSCDDPEPKCQYKPTPGCGCRGDQSWNGFECVDQCEECPPGVARALCNEDPCKGLKCPRYKDAECKSTTCGGCRAKFYFNGDPLSVDDCDNCKRNNWVRCHSKAAEECPLCTSGCQCIKKPALSHDIALAGLVGCWEVYDCVLP